MVKKIVTKKQKLINKENPLPKNDNLKSTNQCIGKLPNNLKEIDIVSTSLEAHHNSEKNIPALLLFQTMSRTIILDKYLHKTIKCKHGFAFKPGEIIKESPHNSIYKC